MARIISITSPSEKTDELLSELQQIEDLLELQVFRQASVEPSGDVIKFAVPNLRLNKVMRLLDSYQLGKQGGLSLSSSEPDSYIPTQSARPIQRDNNQASWEEMEMTISNDSNTSINTLFIMFISGSLAVIGIATNSLHIVIGGMLVAPGFMPITRIALGIISKQQKWYYGSYDIVKGYSVLIIGAAVTTIILQAMGQEVIPGSTEYYVTQKKLITYWTTVTSSSLLASAVASIAGALLVATKKSVFTSGVMIGLALVPTAAIIGMGVVSGKFELAGDALIRFALDVGLVFIFSLIVFVWDRWYYHQRNTSL